MPKLKSLLLLLFVIFLSTNCFAQDIGLFWNTPPVYSESDVELKEITAELIRNGESISVSEELVLYSKDSDSITIYSATMPPEAKVIVNEQEHKLSEAPTVSLTGETRISFEYEVPYGDIIKTNGNSVVVMFCGLIKNITSKETKVHVTYSEVFNISTFSNIPVSFESGKTVWSVDNTVYNVIVAKLSHEENPLLANSIKSQTNIDLFKSEDDGQNEATESDNSSNLLDNSSPQVKEKHDVNNNFSIKKVIFIVLLIVLLILVIVTIVLKRLFKF